MNTIYHYRNNYNTNLNQKVSSPNFKAYNLEAIKKDLIIRILPSENTIKELRSDFINLAKELRQNNSTEFISKYNKFNILAEIIEKIDRIKLEGLKAECSLGLTVNRLELATAEGAKKIKIEENIKKFEEMIADIDTKLNTRYFSWLLRNYYKLISK